MRFLADMGVSLRVVEWLRSRGDDVVHLREQGLQRLPNGDIFEKATVEDRVVLTFDLDFGEIVASSRGSRTSVVVFRRVIARLERVLDESSAALDRVPWSSWRTHVTACGCCPWAGSSVHDGSVTPPTRG